MQVVCCAFTDEEYKRLRAPGEEFERRYGQYGVHKIWRYGMCLHICPGNEWQLSGVFADALLES